MLNNLESYPSSTYVNLIFLCFFADLVKSGKIESRHRELKLIQSKKDIEKPQVKLVAKPEQL